MEATATLTGISSAKGCCDACGRELGRVFQVRYSDGTTGTLGRRCAAKATGYSNPQREADRLARLAAREERRAARRVELVAAGYGADIERLEAMPAAVDCGGFMYASPAHTVLCDVLDGADPAMLARV